MTKLQLANWNFNWINNEKVFTSEQLNVINPATGEIIGQVPSVKEELVHDAIDGAAHALPLWAKLPAKVRAGFLVEWAERILQDQEGLSLLLSREQGKPIKEAIGEIRGAAEIIQWYAEEAKRAYGEIIPASNPGQQLMVFREPVGVVGLITPMNFPAATVIRKVAPALAAGCTAILKPAGPTPMIAIALFQHLMNTNLPKGVANLVTGNSSLIGEVLLSDSRVRKISFTGSTEVGKRLMELAAKNVTRLSLELGGNSPVIIFPDADLDKAVQSVVENKFENCGQVCNGINIIYVHQDVHDRFVEKFVSLVKQLEVGNGESNETDIGPLISQSSLKKVESLVQEAKQKGANVLVGGNKMESGIYKSGNFFEPTVLDDVTGEMKISKEEIFGPVAPILTFFDEKEVLKRANNTPYGLAAYVFTKDTGRMHRMIEGLEVGNIGINGTSLAYIQAPFGGVKESGIGREGGHHGLEEFLEWKYVALTHE